MLYFVGVVIAWVLSLILGAFILPALRRLKFGQEIREEGPAWHASKSGTPTMGGIIFIVGAVAALAGVYLWEAIAGTPDISYFNIILMLFLALAFGAIGFVDDYIKVVKKRNLGLTAAQKFSLQFLVALVFSFIVATFGEVGTVIEIPFSGARVDLSWLYIPFVICVMLATVNSVNLTDGLDGLATTITLIVSLFYTVTAAQIDNTAVALFGSVIAGSLIGFLFYNWKPAKVFMGDTGSLFLGGAVCAMAILMRQPISLLIVGFVYVAETLSVIIQVTSYKLTKKRVFKMSPIHHHFEMCGWHETVIVCVFSAVTLALCLLMYFWG